MYAGFNFPISVGEGGSAHVCRSESGCACMCTAGEESIVESRKLWIYLLKFRSPANSCPVPEHTWIDTLLGGPNHFRRLFLSVYPFVNQLFLARSAR